MKYINIYDDLNIDYECNVLFGKFHNSGKYVINSYKDMIYIKNEVSSNNKKKFYGEVDEALLYKDILRYGKQFYKILYQNLDIIFDCDHFVSITAFNCVSNKIINLERIKLIPICLEFLESYNIPVDMEELNNSFHDSNSISIYYLVNIILLIYIINLIYSNLEKDYDKYKEAYHIFNIDSDFSSVEILETLADFFNLSAGFGFKLGIYKISILKTKGNQYVPLRYTTNLFTFAWEMLQNNFATLSFCEISDTDDEKEFLMFRKCSICLKNLTETVLLSAFSDKIPTMKMQYCEECNNKRKRLRNNKYENH